jgi:hypothetical protein
MTPAYSDMGEYSLTVVCNDPSFPIVATTQTLKVIVINSVTAYINN